MLPKPLYSDPLMKRITIILFTLLSFIQQAAAEHITGGEIYYTFGGESNGTFTYNVTLKLFRNCGNVGAPLDATASIAVYELGTNRLVQEIQQGLSSSRELRLSAPGPCISNAPEVCYQVGFYNFPVSVPASPNGYIIVYQRCCRINGINNVLASGNIGATYTAVIPGTNPVASGPTNNSAKFEGVDTVIVCAGYMFTYNFGAVDPDASDELRYSFCTAYPGGGPSPGTGPNNTSPSPPPPPPYTGVSYNFPFNSSQPLGPNVTIDPATGIITGRAPDQGIYVVTVCVEEIRDGRVIAVQRKDLQIKASGCDIAKPQLDPDIRQCDGYSYTFTQPNNPLINSYYWDFGDPGSGANNTSTQQSPTHVFSAAGVYTVKVVGNRGQECSDSSIAIVRVFPGFFPAFNNTGVCIQNPVHFADATTTNFGVVDKWQWDFGDAGSADVSDQKNLSYQYQSAGTKNVRLIVGNSVGCLDTLIKPLDIIDKPPITLAFKDTLICIPDAVQLQASGTGNFTWTPLVSISNPNTATPTVNPTATTTYYVQLNQEGCINNDSVQVRVVSFVTIIPLADTTICLTDAIQLNVVSDALQYQWTPANTLDDATIPNPVATPTGNTVYQVTGFIGSCRASTSIRVNTVPYPVANAGPDTTICYNTPAQLHGSHDGSSFNWSPATSLLNATTLNPTAYPARTQAYILSSFDTRGCPKPGRDTVLVTVLPKIIPYAGNDTMVVVGQPLQLHAQGGDSYLWIPATGLSNPAIQNPIGIYGPETDSVRYTVRVYNIAGCYDSAFVKVTVFKTQPTVFVPSAFTPNGDGLNDVIRPIAVGISRINYFRIYNRWGQMVFSTTINGHGWDGRIGGTPQASNVYVWMVSAVDYLGRPVFLKGTTTLIR